MTPVVPMSITVALAPVSVVVVVVVAATTTVAVVSRRFPPLSLAAMPAPALFLLVLAPVL